MTQSVDNRPLSHELSGLNRPVELYSLEPGDLIRAELPLTCRSCPELQAKLGEMAFWIPEGRISPQKAANLLIEKTICCKTQY